MRARSAELTRKRTMVKGEAQTLRQGLKQVLVLQGIATVLLLLVVAIWQAVTAGFEDATLFSLVRGGFGSTFYGALLAMAGTILSFRSVMRGFGSGAGQTGWAALGSIYAGLLYKLVIIGGGIAFGLIHLEFQPVWVVTGYGMVQIAGAGVMIRRRTRPEER